MKKIIYIVTALFTLASCKTFVNQIRFYGHRSEVLEENFDSKAKFNNNWEDDSYKSPSSYSIVKGNLKITTRPMTKDRVKVNSKECNFGIGSYEWRIYVPKFRLYDQTSIGAFLYHSKNKEYEFDFEIGSGQRKHRWALEAKSNMAVVHCTSQFKPFSTNRFLVTTEEWHLFKIELSKGERNKYFVKWYIDNKLVKTLQSNVSVMTKFWVYNSLENLSFMGEHLPRKENYVLFDSFTFKHQAQHKSQ